MKFVSALAAFVFMVFFVIIAFVLIGIAFSPESIGFIGSALSAMTGFLVRDVNSRIVTGIAGLLLIFLSVTPLRIVLGNLQRERTISFSNPDGQVQVALAAIEDFIKRLSYEMKDVKELKPRVTTGRKGVEINNRVSFYSGVSIPEVTQKIQSRIKNQVQDMLGIEQAIIVKMHVAKILKKEKGKVKEPELVEGLPIPYR